MTDPRPGGSARLAFGVDIGGTKVLGVAVTPGGQVVAEARVPTPQPAVPAVAGPDDPQAGAPLGEAVAEVVGALRRATGPTGSLTPLGVGVPGLVGPDGVVRFSPNLPWLAGVDAARVVGDRLGMPEVAVDNDATCAALAEHRLGVARDVKRAVVVTLGTGIGGGLVIDGRVERGAHGFAGEVGHMVVDPAGPACPCGLRGCWERFASGAGLGRLAREAAEAGKVPAAVSLAGGDPASVRGEHVAQAAGAGDRGALDVMAELGRWLAVGLANLVAVFDPELLVVGGGLAEVSTLFLEPARRVFSDLVVGGARRPPVPIVSAALGERAGAVGAALLGAGAR